MCSNVNIELIRKWVTKELRIKRINYELIKYRGLMADIHKMAKINQLRSLIRQVARLWCEDENFIRTYCEDQVEAYADDLDRAIACFNVLKAQAEVIAPAMAGGGNAAN